MGALVGFAVGYMLGTQAGPDGVAKIVAAWTEISSSEEFKGMRGAALAGAGGLLGQVMKSGGANLVGGIGTVVSDIRSAA